MNAQLAQDFGPRHYMGGGNVAGVLGLSPYKSPLDEYLTMIGQGDEPDATRERFFKRRKALEPFAAEVFAQETGLQIVRTNVRYDDPEHAFLRAEIDFETEDGCNGETKTVHPLAARDWGDSRTDEIPVYVTAQAMHGLMVTGKQATWVHALIGLDDDRIYRIERDDETIAGMRDIEVAFWNDHVLPQFPPEPRTLSDVRRMFDRDRGTTLEAEGETLAALNQLRVLHPALKAIENEFEALKAQVQIAMGAHASIAIDGKTAATWKSQDTRRFNQTAFGEVHPGLLEEFKHTSQVRVFRVK